MSSILKALKKLEEEKAQRRETPVDIACDILRSPRPHRRSFPTGAVPVVVGGIAVAALAGWLLLTWISFGRPRAASSVEPAPSAQARPQHPPLMNAAAAETRAAADEPEVVEVRIAEPQAPRVSDTGGRPLREPAVTTAKAAAKLPPPMSPPPEPSPESAPRFVRPDLTVSGIAFQLDHQARLAVVNDLPVMEGTEIDGATVEEILPDQVRFSFSGRVFEVNLVKVE